MRSLSSKICYENNLKRQDAMKRKGAKILEVLALETEIF